MADDHHDAQHHHEPGTMDITAQERAFEGFMRWVVNSVIAILVILVFLAFVGA